MFGAKVEGQIWRNPDGRIGHAELHVGGMRFFISDEYETLDVLSPETLRKHGQDACLPIGATPSAAKPGRV